jgi:hypothetical protein
MVTMMMIKFLHPVNQGRESIQWLANPEEALKRSPTVLILMMKMVQRNGDIKVIRLLDK